ncbi:hypothetical protein [Eisenibacter elegans]|uniref:hypothetical protein n=1 Tax=Eisenibacter elegans TaxID=997 RepID=UPI00041F422A|nr:hypothetical protein [Eisenibacter elegans]
MKPLIKHLLPLVLGVLLYTQPVQAQKQYQMAKHQLRFETPDDFVIDKQTDDFFVGNTRNSGIITFSLNAVTNKKRSSQDREAALLALLQEMANSDEVQIREIAEHEQAGFTGLMATATVDGYPALCLFMHAPTGSTKFFAMVVHRTNAQEAAQTLLDSIQRY